MQLDRDNRMKLINFYSAQSQITYSGSLYTGLTEIEEKIESLSYNSIIFAEMKRDVQAAPGGMLVFVNGYLQMDG